MNPRTVSPTVALTTSLDFQMKWQQSDYMDKQLETFLSYNNDAPAIVAVKHSARISIPYGRWTCEDGTEIIFNREYQPMFKRADLTNSFMLPDTWIKDIVKTEYLYSDHNSPVSYLLRKFKGMSLSKMHSTECRNSLAICLKVLEDYYPKNNGNICQTWAPFQIRR